MELVREADLELEAVAGREAVIVSLPDLDWDAVLDDDRVEVNEPDELYVAPDAVCVEVMVRVAVPEEVEVNVEDFERNPEPDAVEESEEIEP